VRSAISPLAAYLSAGYWVLDLYPRISLQDRRRVIDALLFIVLL
jgi:hypothetical protein